MGGIIKKQLIKLLGLNYLGGVSDSDAHIVVKKTLEGKLLGCANKASSNDETSLEVAFMLLSKNNKFWESEEGKSLYEHIARVS
jgi:hypothetical protein